MRLYVLHDGKAKYLLELQRVFSRYTIICLRACIYLLVSSFHGGQWPFHPHLA